MIEKRRQKNNVSTCCLAEVSISGTVNMGPPSISERHQTSHRSPSKCHRSQSSLYFHCAQCYGVQPIADRQSVKTGSTLNIQELSLSGDILKILVLLLACIVLNCGSSSLYVPPCSVCSDVNTVNSVSSLQAGAKENTSSFIRPAKLEYNW